MPGSLDGIRRGAFHACVGGRWMPRLTLPEIVYHEGITGHRFQIALDRELDLPLFQNDLKL
jgi:uncharacterized protein (DUF885 family)